MKSSTIRTLVAVMLLAPLAYVSAAEQSITMTGTLKLAKRKVKGKQYNQVYLVSSTGEKSPLVFKLTDRRTMPSLKEFLNKKVTVAGKGYTKVVKGQGYVILTSVKLEIAEEEAAKEPELVE